MNDLLGVYLMTLGVSTGLLVIIYTFTLAYVLCGRTYKLILLIVLLLLLSNLFSLGLCVSTY